MIKMERWTKGILFNTENLDKFIQLRDPKSDFIFNFNLDDKMKNL